MTKSALGDSAAARILTEWHMAGKITIGDWRKLARLYNQVCFGMNEIWLSGMEEHFKRRLDILFFHDTIEKTRTMALPPLVASYLRNVIKTHHKKVAHEFKIRKQVRRGVGNRIHRETQAR